MFYVVDTLLLWIGLNICSVALYYADSIDTHTVIIVIGPAVILMDLWLTIQGLCFVIGQYARRDNTEYISTV